MNPDGSPNLSVAAEVEPNVSAYLRDDGTLWVADYISRGYGSVSKINAQATLRNRGEVVIERDNEFYDERPLSNPFFSWQHAEQFSGLHRATTCGLSLDTYGYFQRYWRMITPAGYYEWGFRNASRSDAASQPECGSDGDGGGGLPGGGGDEEWYICYYYDIYDEFGNWLYREHVGCVPLNPT